MIITQATPQDMAGIMALHQKYHIDSIAGEEKLDGFVTTNFSVDQLQDLIRKENGITIAKHEDSIVGYAMAASWQFWSQWPFMDHMVQELPKHSYTGQILHKDNSYQYGPVCIDGAFRGKGMFEKVFHASYENMSQKYPYAVTFINQINHRSYAAHTKKVSMETIGTFQYNNNQYYILAYAAAIHNRDEK